MSELTDQANEANGGKIIELKEHQGLILLAMRHCEDVWETYEVDPRTGARKIPFDDNYSDKERPLTEKGKLQAAAIGKWLKENGFMPDAVMASDGTRIQQTLEHMGFDGQLEGRVWTLESLYSCKKGEDYIGNLQAIEAIHPNAKDAKVVLMLGRKPPIPEAVETFVGNHNGNGELPFSSKEYQHGMVSVVSFKDCKGWIDIWGPEGFAKGELRAVAAPDTEGNVIVLKNGDLSGSADAPELYELN